MGAGGCHRAVLTMGLVLLAGCALPPGQLPAEAARRAVPVAELAARLPAEAAGFRRGATTDLTQGGEVGRETAYRTMGRTAAGATVQLVRLSGGPVPEGAEGPAVDAAFEALLQEATRPLPQRRLQHDARFTLGSGLRCAETHGVYGRERVQGLLCAGGLGGGVLRLRVTMPQHDPAPADARAFAGSILAALRVP